MSIKPRLHGPNNETETEWFGRFADDVLDNRLKERARLRPLLAELGVDDDPALVLDSDVMTSTAYNDLVLRIIELECAVRDN